MALHQAPCSTLLKFGLRAWCGLVVQAGVYAAFCALRSGEDLREQAASRDQYPRGKWNRKPSALADATKQNRR